ncbi:MAG: hypothetical protein AAFU67_04125 [Bacteroidota bacterium]
MLGAGLGGFSLTGSDPSFSNITISPDVHYFISSRFALGLGMILNNVSAGEFSNTNTSFGPNARFYFSNPKHFMPFIQAGASFSGSSTSLGIETESSTAIDAGIGGNIFLRDRLALEVGVNVKVFPDLDGEIIGLNLGARVLLGKGNNAVNF